MLDALVTAPGGVHVARSDDDDRASESHTRARVCMRKGRRL